MHILLIKPVYLGLLLLKSSKILLYEFHYNELKPKYSEKTKLCCMDTDSFNAYITTDNIYIDISEDVETTILDKTVETK